MRVNKLTEQLDLLQKDLEAREFSQKELKNEVVRVEHDMKLAMSNSGAKNDCKLWKILDIVSPKNLEKMNRVMILKDEEIAKLRDEIRIISAHWEIKTKELELQLEKHRRADQELKKRVLKLEFCLQEARAQTRKLQGMGERRDIAIKELQDQLAAKNPSGDVNSENKQFWKSSGFQIAISMWMLVLVLFSKC